MKPALHVIDLVSFSSAGNLSSMPYRSCVFFKTSRQSIKRTPYRSLILCLFFCATCSYVGLVYALLGSVLLGQLRCKCVAEIAPSRHTWVV